MIGRIERWLNMKPRWVKLFVWVGVVLWLVVTAAALALVIQSPREHLDLALGVFLIWVVLVVFAAFARVTEYIGPGHR